MAVEKRRGKWAYRFMFGGEVYFKGGFGTAAEAENAERELRLILDQHDTFYSLVEKRMHHVNAYCSKQHIVDTRTLLRPFIEEWGYLPLMLITPEMVRQAVLALTKRTTNNNVNRHLRALRSLFQLGVDQGIIGKNPTAGIKFLPTEAKQKVIPTAAEIKEVILRAKPEDQAYLTVIWLTGARVNEIHNLTWDNVDLEGKSLWLATRKSKLGNKVYREIPIVPQVESALRLMWKRRVGPWVFVNPQTGDKYGYRSKLLKNLSGGKFTYHHLRHSTASTLAALGVELPVIQKILGHSRPTTTDRYLSTLPSGVIDGMEKLGQFLTEVEDAN